MEPIGASQWVGRIVKHNLISCRSYSRSAGREKIRVQIMHGATVIIDPYGKVQYVIRKSVLAEGRLGRQRSSITYQPLQ